MSNLEFHATTDQRHALEGLSYWHADLNYLYERFPNDVHAIEKARQTIELCFDVLDRLRVPFWVQNNVLAWSEEWRNTERDYLRHAMEKKNIFL